MKKDISEGSILHDYIYRLFLKQHSLRDEKWIRGYKILGIVVEVRVAAKAQYTRVSK